jgi:hypothetical protein
LPTKPKCIAHLVVEFARAKPKTPLRLKLCDAENLIWPVAAEKALSKNLPSLLTRIPGEMPGFIQPAGIGNPPGSKAFGL